MINLYKLNTEIEALETALIDSEGEITPEVEEIMMGFDALLTEQTDAIIEYAAYLEDGISAAKERAREISDVKKGYERRLERFRALVIETMVRLGRTKQETLLGRITLPKRGVKASIVEQDRIPLQFIREIPAQHMPDIVEITKALKEGKEVPGAELVPAKQSIKIGKKR